MFEAVGRGPQMKRLSPLRWLASAGIAILMGAALLGANWAANRQPEQVAKTETKVEEVTFQQTVKPPPPPPPPPPGPTPKSTTRPMKNRITKTVKKEEIKPPEPTPQPEKKPEEPKTEEKPAEAPAEEEVASVADDGGVPGGVPGGVLGGVIGGVVGGVVGGTGTGTGVDIQEVDFKAGDFLNARDVQRVAKDNFPEMIKRANIAVADATVEVVCDPDGSVSEVIWISGNELVREAVMAAVKQARFSSRPHSFKVRVPFRFRLQ